MKRYKITLTEKQLDAIQAALFEYAEVCEYEESTTSDKVSKYINSVSKSLSKQQRKQDGEEK